MTIAPVGPRSPSAIVGIFDEDFTGVPARQDEEPEAHEVAAQVWERALRGPLRELLSRQGKGLRGRLVEACWHIARGTDEPVPELLPIMIEALHAGSLIIDDIEDGSTERRGGLPLHELVGTPIALNAGNWLYIWPQRLVGKLEVEPAVRARLHEEIDLALLRCHQGQALDLAVRPFDLEQEEVAPLVRTLTRLKTGGLMELAATIPAIAAGAPEPITKQLGRLGRDVGIGLQMLDDLAGIVDDGRGHKGDEDLRLARATWPWAWLAADCPSPLFDAAMQHLRAVAEGASPQELRAWMRSRLSESGLRRARGHIDRAIAELRAELGNAPGVVALSSELSTLEARYVRR